MLRFEARIEIDGKPEPRTWKNNEGKEQLSYKLNISQNDGCDVATVGCTESIYNSVRRHDVANACFLFSDGGTSGKPYLKLESLEVTTTPLSATPFAGGKSVNAPVSTK